MEGRRGEGGGYLGQVAECKVLRRQLGHAVDEALAGCLSLPQVVSFLPERSELRLSTGHLLQHALRRCTRATTSGPRVREGARGGV